LVDLLWCVARRCVSHQFNAHIDPSHARSQVETGSQRNQTCARRVGFGEERFSALEVSRRCLGKLAPAFRRRTAPTRLVPRDVQERREARLVGCVPVIVGGEAGGVLRNAACVMARLNCNVAARLLVVPECDAACVRRWESRCIHPSAAKGCEGYQGPIVVGLL
jgi:hypothetical protein